MMNTTPKPEPAPTNGAAAPALSASTAMVLGSDSYRGALEPRGLADAFEIGQMIASSGLFGITSPGEAVAKIMYGRTIGISAMQSLQSLHSIEGKMGIEASLMMALCLRATHICDYFEPVLAECDDEKATFVTKRRDRPEQRFVYTIADAEKMGVVDRGADAEKKKKNNWNANRRAMLMARCKSTLARQVYPDVTHGLLTSEELYDQQTSNDDEMVGEVLSPAEAKAAAAAGPVVSVQVKQRDYAGELAALKDRLAAATSRAQRAEVRAAFDQWDGIEPFRQQFTEAYNATIARKPAAAPTAPASDPTVAGATPPAAQPSLMPDGNLFGAPPAPPASPKPEGEGK